MLLSFFWNTSNSLIPSSTFWLMSSPEVDRSDIIMFGFISRYLLCISIMSFHLICYVPRGRRRDLCVGQNPSNVVILSVLIVCIIERHEKNHLHSQVRSISIEIGNTTYESKQFIDINLNNLSTLPQNKYSHPKTTPRPLPSFSVLKPSCSLSFFRRTSCSLLYHHSTNSSSFTLPVWFLSICDQVFRASFSLLKGAPSWAAIICISSNSM